MKTRLAMISLIAAGVAAAASAESFEKTVPVPRTGVARLNWTSGQCSVVLVELRNYPEAEDIEKARKSDPNDHSWVWWDFNVENRGDTKCKIKLWVEVLDKSGKVLKQSDRSDTVDAHKLDDNIKVSTRMRTIDIADAPKAHLKAEITSK
ncbi:MAG TPA: hypothetical protein VMQ61_07710 [Thermoanaerobaculia bacterium]|nr:hypothetical protein [Thermoanaerobaculia bacterium]